MGLFQVFFEALEGDFLHHFIAGMGGVHNVARKLCGERPLGGVIVDVEKTAKR